MLTGAEARAGRAAENCVRDIYKAAGWYVLPAHLIENGGAPLVLARLRNFTAPDFVVGKPGVIPRMLEVKFKSAPFLFQKMRDWQHGIDRPNWEAYEELDRVSGFRVDIAIVQVKPGPQAPIEPMLLFQSVEALAAVRIDEIAPNKKGPRGMVYFSCTAFDVAPINTAMLPRNLPELMRLRTSVYPWECAAKNGHVPSMKDPPPPPREPKVKQPDPQIYFRL
jgi:hypothetical protein